MSTFFERALRFNDSNRSFRFTPSGVRFIAMTLAVGVAAINTGNNLLYLILAMMLSLIILSGILSEGSLRHLRAERILSPHLFAGRPLPIHQELSNQRRWLPSFCFSVHEVEGPGITARPLYVYKLVAGQRLLAQAPILFQRRGCYTLKGVRFETAFPFGFFQKSLIRHQPQQIVVYPRLLSLPPEVLAMLTGLGEARQARLRGPGDTFKNLRDYFPGDDARAIHWKASARSGKLLSKEYEHEEEQRLILCLSNHLPHPATEQDRLLLEQAISLTASLAYHWVLDGHAIQLKTLTQETPMDSGLSHLFEILKLLALLEPVETPSLENIPFRSTTTLSVPKVLILPQPDSRWEGREADFSRVLTVTDPGLQCDWSQETAL